MTEDQIRKQRESLVGELLDVIERHKTDLATSMMATDIIGVLEYVKLHYYAETK